MMQNKPLTVRLETYDTVELIAVRSSRVSHLRVNFNLLISANHFMVNYNKNFVS